MKQSIKTGFSFGLTSAIITTLGLIVGLYAGTNSRVAVVGGVIMIAVADAFSDSLGVHISEESKNASKKDIWESSFSTFATKFIIALTFLIPIVFFSLKSAVVLSIVWGLLLLSLFSYYIGRSNGGNPLSVVVEHVLIAVVVIVLTYFLGEFISGLF